jgi:hypothetical protein
VYARLFYVTYENPDAGAVAADFATILKFVIATENKPFYKTSLFKSILEITGDFSRFRRTLPHSCFMQIRVMAFSVIPISLFKF